MSVDFGHGPPLVFVHGFLASGDLWRDTANLLATSHRCIVPDWPLGSHQVPLSPDADLSPAGVARLVAEVLDALDLEGVTLIGNDTGGVICQLVVADHPSRIGRLVLTPCDGFEIYPPPGFGYLRWLPFVPGLLYVLARSMLHFTPLRRLSTAYGALTRRPAPAALLRRFVEPAETRPPGLERRRALLPARPGAAPRRGARRRPRRHHPRHRRVPPRSTAPTRWPTGSATSWPTRPCLSGPRRRWRERESGETSGAIEFRPGVPPMRVHHQSCHLCEASCGVRITVDGDRITDIRGDEDDPHSRGYICPKVMALQDIHEDPDRLRTPLVRDRATGRLDACSWDEAFDRVAARLKAIQREHGPDAIAVYQGNPTAHNFGLLSFGQIFMRRLGTKNLYSATSSDQLPHMLSSLLMFGHQLLLPVPDIERTDYWLVLGANPAVSNGSLMTAPDIKRRIAALRARGGRVVVIDPRRTETARLADRHLFLRPGTDALFLLALLHTLHAEDRIRPGRLAAHATGTQEVRALSAGFAPERVAAATGIAAEDIRTIARELAAAPSAAVYGRVGACTQEFGGLTSWLINLVNFVTDNLDRSGGAMFSTPPIDLLALAARVGHGGGFDRFRSRVRGLPEFGGELPGSVLAEEIDTPGPGRIRGLLTSAGNPVLSTPNGGRLDRALPLLDFMVSIDFYLNETTRHADVILPPTFALERDQFELAAFVVSVRNGAKAWRALFPRSPEQRHDWEICLELMSRMELGGGLVGRAGSALMRRAGRRLGPRGLAAAGLALGPYRKRRMSLRRLEASPHGVDLGALEARLPDALHTDDRKIHLVPREYLADLARLTERWLGASAEVADERPFLLIGRRHLRSNNSWLHNSRRLVKGKPRCTLLVHPDDAARVGLSDGGSARVSSRVGATVVPVQVSDEIMPGVISLPHGWGHDRPGIGLRVAAAQPGQSVNDLTDETFFDRLSGTSALVGVPVALEPA